LRGDFTGEHLDGSVVLLVGPDIANPGQPFLFALGFVLFAALCLCFRHVQIVSAFPETCKRLLLFFSAAQYFAVAVHPVPADGDGLGVEIPALAHGLNLLRLASVVHASLAPGH
jgi:hypothetical protein